MDNYKDFDTKSLTSSHGQVPNLTGVGDSHFLLADSDASQMSKPSYLQDKFKQVSIGLRDKRLFWSSGIANVTNSFPLFCHNLITPISWENHLFFPQYLQFYLPLHKSSTSRTYNFSESSEFKHNNKRISGAEDKKETKRADEGTLYTSDPGSYTSDLYSRCSTKRLFYLS